MVTMPAPKLLLLAPAVVRLSLGAAHLGGKVGVAKAGTLTARVPNIAAFATKIYQAGNAATAANSAARPSMAATIANRLGQIGDAVAIANDLLALRSSIRTAKPLERAAIAANIAAQIWQAAKQLEAQRGPGVAGHSASVASRINAVPIAQRVSKLTPAAVIANATPVVVPVKEMVYQPSTVLYASSEQPSAMYSADASI